MRFFDKCSNSRILQEAWVYPKDRRKIAEALRQEQLGFCAYSEKVLTKTDAADIEHYDPRLKPEPTDGYENWYYVGTQLNRWKPRKVDDRFLPIHERPCLTDLSEKIDYRDGQFIPLDARDTKTRNFLRFIGANRPELFEERKRHIDRMIYVRETFGSDLAAFLNMLHNDRQKLSFLTALEAELGLERELLTIARESFEPQPSSTTERSQKE